MFRALVRGEVRGDERHGVAASELGSDHEPALISDGVEHARGLVPDAHLAHEIRDGVGGEDDETHLEEDGGLDDAVPRSDGGFDHVEPVVSHFHLLRHLGAGVVARGGADDGAERG